MEISTKITAAGPTWLTRPVLIALALVIALLGLFAYSQARGNGLWSRRNDETGQKAQAVKAYEALPSRFIPNRGQLNKKVKFFAQTPGYSFYLTNNEIAYLFLRQAKTRPKPGPSATKGKPQPVAGGALALKAKFVGASPRVAVVGRRRQSGAFNYLIGNKPEAWKTNVPGYSEVFYRGLYPGIDLTYKGVDGRMKYQFNLAPGADPKAIRILFQGAKALKTTPEGALLIHTPWGTLKDTKPYAYQIVDGKRSTVEAEFSAEGRVATFWLGDYDKTKPLVIDPVMKYSTFVGGGGGSAQTSYAISVDTTGNAYITGTTDATDYPTTAGAYDTSLNSATGNVFVAKLNASGSGLVYSTFIGGSTQNAWDAGYDISVDAGGNAYIVGQADEASFPTTVGAFDRTVGGASDGFALKLNAAGSGLVYSTFLGGTSAWQENAWGVAVDSSGSAYVTGLAGAGNYGGPSDYPVTAGAYDTTSNGGYYDVFVTKLNPAGSALVYSTFLGGDGNDDAGYDISVDSTGNAYVTGRAGASASQPFPTTAGSFDTAFGGYNDVFVTKLNPAGSGLVYSTFLGGTMIDEGYGISIDSTGYAYITGETGSSDYPTTVGAYDRTYNGDGTLWPDEYNDAFIAKLNLDGSGLVYSTYLGGANGDVGRGISLGGDGRAYVVGQTKSANFPTTSGAFDASFGGGWDGFIASVGSTGSALKYSSYLGGAGDDFGRALKVDGAGGAYMTGETYSGDFPVTSGAYDTTKNSVHYADAFASKLYIAQTTTLKLTPDLASGSNGWYKGAAPTASLSNNSSGTSYYQWDSTGASGWTTATASFSAPQGQHTLYYRTITGGDAESINSDFIKADSGLPVDPVGGSASHGIGGVSTDKTIDIAWAGESDAVSGVDGFSIEWNNSATSTPDAVKDMEESVHAATSQPLADGVWYFHLRTVDYAGNWTSTMHLGPFIIKASPHGGFSTASNLCAVCHAVHGGEEGSWRLLPDGNSTETRSPGEGSLAGRGRSRATECMYCHDATSGLTGMRPYEIGAQGTTVRGEHTIGAAWIPDSDINGGSGDKGNLANRDAGGEGAVLQCYQCHSVHGADTIGHDANGDGSLDPVSDGYIYDGNGLGENWNTKILRIDPGGDGTILAKGSGGLTISDWAGQLAADPAAVRTGFCADCHDQNPNWAMSTADTDRPNTRSHPQGPGIDSNMAVNDQTMTVAAHNLPRLGCRGCHYASADASGGPSRFPHQSTGWKLLYDEAVATGSADLAGDPYRVIPKMDEVCLSCHAVFTELDTNIIEEGVCLICHDSKYGAPDVGDEIRKASAHPTAETSYTGRHKEGESAPADFAAPNQRHAECQDCHSAKNVLPWENSPLAGIWGVGVTNGGAGTEPGYAVKSPVAEEYELCFKCHSGWTTQPNSVLYADASGTPLKQGNKALESNPNNSAFHPVEGPGRNISSNLNAQLAAAGLSTSSVLKCTDCHNSNATADESGTAANSTFRPKGPHGSTNNSNLSSPNHLVLRAFYYTDIAGPTTWDPANFALCFMCHDQFTLMGDSNLWSWGKTNFDNPGWYNEHFEHLYLGVGVGVTCRNCHYNIHSNQAAPNTMYQYRTTAGVWQPETSTPPPGIKTHLVNFSPDLRRTLAGTGTPLWRIDLTINRRSCYVVCHGYRMNGAQYRPTSGDDSPTF